MAEQLGFEEVVGDGGAVHRHERLVLAVRLGMHEPRDDFLAGAAFPGDEDGGFRPGDLLGQAHHARHRLVPEDEGAVVARDGLKDGCDQFRVGRERDVLPRSGLDCQYRRARVRSRAARHHRCTDPLGLELLHQFVDRQHDVDHDEIGALAAHHRQRLLDRLRVGDGRAAIHRDPRRYGKLALESADDEKPHGFVLRFSGQP